MAFEMTIYAIRHKPTGAFMPARMFRASGRGWSHWGPGCGDAATPHDPNPRVFYTRESARNALTAWLQGVWEQGGYTSGSYFEAPEQITSPMVNNPPTPRNREDMEIVVLWIQETAGRG